MRFLQYVTPQGKFVFVPVTKTGSDYDFPEINEWHIIAGFYEYGQMKSLANSNILPIEIYAMHNDVDFGMINRNDFHPPGRKFVFVESEVKSEKVELSGNGGGDTIDPLIKSIKPDTDNAYDIGEVSKRINQVYAQKIGPSTGTSNNIDMSGSTWFYWASGHNFRVSGGTVLNLLSSLIIIYKQLRPNIDNTVDLGDPSFNWRNVYAQDVTVKNGASGSFTTNDGKTVTVANGIVTSIV